MVRAAATADRNLTSVSVEAGEQTQAKALSAYRRMIRGVAVSKSAFFI
jgi:hypothetical protein